MNRQIGSVVRGVMERGERLPEDMMVLRPAAYFWHRLRRELVGLEFDSYEWAMFRNDPEPPSQAQVVLDFTSS
jgi:hypothetical protein